jgi:hypothetical protein
MFIPTYCSRMMVLKRSQSSREGGSRGGRRLKGGKSISLTAEESKGEDAAEYGEDTKSKSMLFIWNCMSIVRTRLRRKDRAKR